MKKMIVVLAVVVLLMSSFPTIVFAAPPDNPSPVSDFSSEQILVKFKSGVTLPEAAQIHGRFGGHVKETISGIGVQVITVPRGQAKEKDIPLTFPSGLVALTHVMVTPFVISCGLLPTSIDLS